MNQIGCAQEFDLALRASRAVELDIDDPLNCLAVFKSNRDAGLILFAALALETILRRVA